MIDWKPLDVSFQQIFFEKLRMIKIGPRHPSKKNILQKANEQKKKKTICQIFHQKKNSESFDEN